MDEIDIGLSVFVALIVFILVIGFFVIREETKIDDAFRNGDITLEQYCDQVTLGGTTTKLPVACYGQFNLKAVGTHEECNHNGKTTTCATYPTLESNTKTLWKTD
jgi:hypothetical protein